MCAAKDVTSRYSNLRFRSDSESEEEEMKEPVFLADTNRPIVNVEDTEESENEVDKYARRINLRGTPEECEWEPTPSEAAAITDWHERRRLYVPMTDEEDYQSYQEDVDANTDDIEDIMTRYPYVPRKAFSNKPLGIRNPRKVWMKEFKEKEGEREEYYRKLSEEREERRNRSAERRYWEAERKAEEEQKERQRMWQEASVDEIFIVLDGAQAKSKPKTKKKSPNKPAESPDNSGYLGDQSQGEEESFEDEQSEGPDVIVEKEVTVEENDEEYVKDSEKAREIKSKTKKNCSCTLFKRIAADFTN